ncbi:T6SS immunity protein Tli4 family protein [Massilia horti]|uniref:Tle cognate immunity protein 4 C-terminal domain-containing protein n=1 Tax=Massilia horti TaxID=2562153 RepID=A0A4Y9SWN2_9BURK|nr:T6SS immunity protein Tli4 family protein [Massilia horti]TFW31005.1 hypothetical protein E4O92_14960 [Massilia horti]
MFHMTTIPRFCLVCLAAATLMLVACDRNPKEWKTPNMTELTPRLKPLFDKTKTVCFGRFLVDVPESATVVWGNADVSLGVRIYPKGVDQVKEFAQKFIDELKGEKAIYHNYIPLFISEDNVVQPQGKIVTGYEGFTAVNGLKINGYFRLNDDGVVIESRPLSDEKDETIAEIISIARRLRQHSETEIPTEPGNCVEYAFLSDKSEPDKELPMEHIRIGFRLKEFPDTHLSIYVAPANPYNPEDDSLERQFNRVRAGAKSPESKKALADTKFLRESPRQIHDWQTGYEVLMRSPDEERSRAHHDFRMKFVGVPRDLYKPYADIQFQTGVADNAAGAAKASLTDEEAIAVWDKITSSIRVRPTVATPAKTSQADSPPHRPLGELAATGRICPQTGWWQASESEGDQRQHFKAGERMPHVISHGEPSVWQKLKGERPSYRTATVWKLVEYGDPPAADAVTQTSKIAQASQGVSGGATEGKPGEDTSSGTKG